VDTDGCVFDALGSRLRRPHTRADPEIYCQAVEAAGSWELAGAWSDVVALVGDDATPKSLLLAAIGAVASIRSVQADLADSDDEEIAEAVDEAMAMAGAVSDEEDDEWMNE
jgi:hypothetical protein